MPRKPSSFHDFVGHPKLVARLRRQLDGAKAHAEPFPHTMFVGPSGVGKTLLARALASEYGSTTHFAHGNDCLNDLAAKCAKAGFGDFLVIDEAHGLQNKCQDLLLYVIDEQQLPWWVEAPASESAPDEQEARQLSAFTLVLATDQAGQLHNALSKRMEFNESIDHYRPREMQVIVDHIAARLGIFISPQARNCIVKIADGLPRIARHHLRLIRRRFPDASGRQLRLEDVRQYLAEFEIDELGLDGTDRQYLSHLAETGGASLDSLALHLTHDPGYVRRDIEARLHRKKLIRITPGGRKLSEKGRAHLQNLGAKKKENNG